MYRLSVFVAIFLVLISSSALARTVRKDGQSSVENGTNDQNVADSDNIESTTAGCQGATQLATIDTTISNDDVDTTMATTAASTTASMKVVYRKRRALNIIAQSTTHPKVKSESEEKEGSGDSKGSDGRTQNLISSSEELLPKSEVNGTIKASSASSPFLDSSSNELGSGYGDQQPIGTSSKEVADQKAAEVEQVDLLKKKLQNWQSSVDNYLYGKEQRRRRKRQLSSWSQLFPSDTYSSVRTSKGTDSLFAAAGNAVSEALKPAMELLSQGVDLLGDLYSSQLSKNDNSVSSRLLPSNNTSDAMAPDQFRGQLKQLQSKLGDLGEQLQRVVKTFQQAQLPFFNDILSGGPFPFNEQSPMAKTDNRKGNVPYGKSKNENNV